MADYVIRGRLEIAYDARRLEQQVQYSMQRVQRIATGTGTRLGQLLGTGLFRGVNAAVTDSNRRIGSIATVAKTTGRLAGEQMARGITAKLGALKLGGGAGGASGHWTAGPKGWGAMFGAQLGSGSGLMSSIGGALGGRFGPVGAAIGATVGRTISLGFSPFISALDQATRSLLAMNSSLQQSEYGMASLFSANLGTSFEDSRKLSKGVIRDLRLDAAMGVGDEPQYLQTYQQLMTPALAAGADLDRLRRLTRLTVGAGALSGRVGGMELASLDILQALSGSASDRTMQVLGPLLKAKGVDFGRLNAMGSGDRLKAIEDALLGLEPGINEMGKTWESRTGAFSALMRNFVITGTSGLFERMSEALGSFNDWLSKSEKRLSYFVRGVGEFLVSLWDVGAAVANGVRPWLDGIFRDLRVWGYELRLLAENLGIASDTSAGFGYSLGGAFRWFTSTVSGGLAALNLFTLHLEELFSGLLTMADVLGRLWTGAGWIANPFEIADAVTGAGQAGGARQADIERRRRAVLDPSVSGRSRFSSDNDLEALLRGLRPVNNFNGPIEVKVDTEVNADPSRVALAWEEAFGKVLRNRRQPRRGGFAPAT